MAVTALLFFCLFINTQGLPWSQCCTEEGEKIRCQDVNRHADCTAITLPNKPLKEVILDDSIAKIEFLTNTAIKILRVKNLRQFLTICSEKIQKIYFKDKVKRCDDTPTPAVEARTYESTSDHSNIVASERNIEIVNITNQFTKQTVRMSSIVKKIQYSFVTPIDNHPDPFHTNDLNLNFSAIVDTARDDEPTTLETPTSPLPSTFPLPNVSTTYTPDKLTIIIVIPISMLTLVSVIVAVFRYIYLRCTRVQDTGNPQPVRPENVRPLALPPVRSARQPTPTQRTRRPNHPPARPPTLPSVQLSNRPTPSTSFVPTPTVASSPTLSYKTANSRNDTSASSSMSSLSSNSDEHEYNLRRLARINYKV